VTLDLVFGAATEADASAIARLRTDAAERLTRDFGRGHWSSTVSETGVLSGMRGSYVLVVRDAAEIAGTLTLSTRKPWAINPAYFSNVRRPLYLTDMAVDPPKQRLGIGRHLLVEATSIARRWPADAIRLDAYDASAGASTFYAKCGFHEVGRVVYRGTPLVYFELVL